jgi:hypothetical protein
MAVLALGFQLLGVELLVKLRPDPELALVGAESSGLNSTISARLGTEGGGLQ